MRAPLMLLAAVLLLATAAFHFTGLAEAATWADGTRGEMVQLLWIAPAASWVLIALFWLQQSLTGRFSGWPAMWMSALIPAIVAVPLLVQVSPAHPGGYMLLAASALALAGARRIA